MADLFTPPPPVRENQTDIDGINKAIKETEEEILMQEVSVNELRDYLNELHSNRIALECGIAVGACIQYERWLYYVFGYTTVSGKDALKMRAVIDGVFGHEHYFFIAIIQAKGSIVEAKEDDIYRQHALKNEHIIKR